MIVESSIILVCILAVGYVTFKIRRVRPWSEKEYENILKITFPTIEPEIQDSIHQTGEPFFGLRVEKINKSPLAMLPLDSFATIQKIFPS